MKHCNILLLGMLCHSSRIFHAEAAANHLRGTNTTVITENEMHQDQHTNSSQENPVLLSQDSGTVQNIFRVIGRDERVAFEPTAHPWTTAVGKVQTEAGQCTGTMIGSRLMLTAQHCINRRADGSTGWMKFTPAYYDGNAPYGSANAEFFSYDQKMPKIPEGGAPVSEFAWDYVVVKLDSSIGEKSGWWDFKVYQPEWNGKSYWMNIGYTGHSVLSKGERPLYHEASPIDSVQSYSTSSGIKSMLMMNTIDITPGHSGGPVFGFFIENNKHVPYVIGVAVGSGSSNVACGGQGLHDLIIRKRLE